MTRQPPGRVYTADLPTGTAVLDTRSGRGRWRHLNPTAAMLWHRLVAGADPDRTVAELAREIVASGIGGLDTVHADLSTAARQLGSLAASANPPPPSTDARLRPDPSPHTRASPADRAAAGAALTASLVLLRALPIHVSISLVRTAARLPRPDATPLRADAMLSAVRRAACWWPGRCACLEESLALTLCAALRGRRVTWVIGARNAATPGHAWVETHGEIIGQDQSVDRIGWPYRAVLRV